MNIFFPILSGDDDPSSRRRSQSISAAAKDWLQQQQAMFRGNADIALGKSSSQCETSIDFLVLSRDICPKSSA